MVIGQASEIENNPVETLQVKPLRGIEFVPTRGTGDAAGLDVRASEDVAIPAGQRKLVPLGIACRCPRGSYIRIAPRSSMAYKQSMDVGVGVVGRDYTGEIKVLLCNNGQDTVAIKKGDRVA